MNRYGVIRKIIIGPDPKNAMAYYVGMKVPMGVVDSISIDEREDRSVRYLVYVSTEEGIELWKSIEGMPCLIEFNLDF